jgi:phospholipid-binding lipoprotein MlaA
MASACKSLSLRLLAVALVLVFVGGCATGTHPGDPFEPINRGIYKFNEGVDKAILKPTAQVYRAVVPQFVRSSVSNFFSNINDVVVALNNLLQGKFTAAYSDLGRIAINSTIGMLGLFDVASEAGIEKHDEDFGQTLGRWGVGNGPFIMIPIFGPSNGRDLVGRAVDFKADPVTYVDPSRSRNQLWAGRAVNRRAELLDASTVLQTAALDPYEFVRDAYLQRRRSLIYDGAPPPDKEFLDPPPASPKSSLPLDRPISAVAEPASPGYTMRGGAPAVRVIPIPQPDPAGVEVRPLMPVRAPAEAAVTLPAKEPTRPSTSAVSASESPVPPYVERSEPVAMATTAVPGQPQQASTFVKARRAVEQLFR